MEPTPALPKGGSLNEAQYIYSPPLGRVGVGSSPSLWEGRGRLLLSPLFDGICNPVVLNIGICNAVVVVGLQILIIVAARIANPAERGYSVAGCCISTLDTPSIYISDKPHLLS